ncbi:FtsH protease activity modulator HflK [Thiococcus pfennigii]|jgi:membrane protease subunit HflK|uniref:FtsH protease activity modulator HflK n=1 Tax=Thiococcus pfennigii TaxID=1057 RepID=UPI0019055631|nr:FtsH protease activity modulator HflK [Thiococcus pfennigii]MBK1731309.1 FtsH protease activity modulator HflK [Thiococcus pfennigii]
MAWNEPGGGNRDPWGNKGGEQGPPDLDEVVRKLQDKLGGLFGGRRSGGTGGGGGSAGGFNARLIGIIGGILLAIWLATGIYIVGPAERGVELRFGAYTTTTGPGPHWHIPYPVESVVKVNVDEVSTFTHQAAMLTKDENIVELELTVQSRIQDAADFLFQDQDPNKTLRDATETVVRTTIGASRLDFILTEGRGAIAVQIQERVQDLMNGYRTGLLVTSVNMQPARPPEQVKDAFDDAIKAREDKERIENTAEAYANEILPKARGEAARIVADAKAYRDRVVAEAEGQTARFLAVLTEYRKAPDVTRERLYLETMQEVLGRSSKVVVDVADGDSVMYLPLDQLLRQSRDKAASASTSSDGQVQPSVQGTSALTPSRAVNRERSVR